MKKPTGPRSDESDSAVDVAAIDALARIVSAYDLTEVEVDVGAFRVRLARERASVVTPGAAPAPAVSPPPVVAPAAAGSPPARAEPEADLAGAVRSPMVGTAYLRPNPETKPFIEIGSTVKAGDKLLLVEAMKTFNDIVSPRAGKVAAILVTDGSPVEYDQPLVVIE